MKAYSFVYTDTEGYVHKVVINGQYKVYSTLDALLNDKDMVEQLILCKLRGRLRLKKGKFPFYRDTTYYEPYPEHEQILAKRMLDTLTYKECKIL